MYALLEQLTLQAVFPLAALCETLEVSRAGYYAWRSESQSAQQQRDRELTPLVCDIFWKHKRRYGARRIAVELGALGQPCGVDRVAKLLKIQGLRAIQPQSLRLLADELVALEVVNYRFQTPLVSNQSQSNAGSRHPWVRRPRLVHGPLKAAAGGAAQGNRGSKGVGWRGTAVAKLLLVVP